MIAVGAEIANYRVLEKIGEGGMGMVYKAIDVNLDRIVALKLLNSDLAGRPELAERFRAEARMQASFSHPNVAMLYAFLVWEGSAVMVMEFIEGETFRDMILRRGPVPGERALPMFKQALLGIREAHARGIVHRDIKPANIMLSRGGLVKVMDFGIAKALGAAGATRTNIQMGTAWYMSPEQVLNRSVDARSDIYSLGITLYELLTAQVPFNADSEFEIQMAHVQRDPPRPAVYLPNIPPAIENAILRAMAKNPADRFQSVEDFSAALPLQPLHSSDSASIPSTAGHAATANRTGPRSLAEPRPQGSGFSIERSKPVPAQPTPVPFAPTPAPPRKTTAPFWKTHRGATIAAGAAAIVIAIVVAVLYSNQIAEQKEREREELVRQQEQAESKRQELLEEDRKRQAAQDDQAGIRELEQKLQEEEEAAKRDAQNGSAHRPRPSGAPDTQTQAEDKPAPPPPASSSNNAPPSYAQQLSGIWRGTYLCVTGLNQMELNIRAAPTGKVAALVRFRVPNGRPGAYYTQGVFSPQSRQLSLFFTGWQYHPPNYIPANIAGIVNLEQGTMAGSVIVMGCTTFAAHRQ